MTSRSYCVTFWKKPAAIDDTKIRYAIYGLEICPETKKEHWQSYIEFEKAIRPAAVKKIYNDNTCHIEKRKGTREEARTYCMKDNNFTEHGKWIKGQGHRTDLDLIVESMKEGKPLSEVMIEESTTYCKYRNGLKDIAGEIVKKKTKEFRKLEVELITGPTGTGKTRNAVEENPEHYKIEGENLQWFDGYEQEKTLIIDEYDNQVNVTKLLNILDGYQLRLPIKGGFTWANYTKVVITTNLKLDEIHAKAKPEHRNALFRRITKIKNLWPCHDDET